MPPSRSFLGRVTKYVPREKLDAGENRLTEVTAGVLEHVKGFAAPFVASTLDFAADDLVMRAKAPAHGERCALQQRAKELRELRDCIDAYGGWRVEVRTQVGTSSGRFVDLEIRLRSELLRHDTDLVFWIEVKHGAPVHGDQLEAYEREIPEGVVLVVAPLQRHGGGEPPPTWRQTFLDWGLSTTMAGVRLEGQARYLADWVVGRFEAVTAVPPPN